MVTDEKKESNWSAICVHTDEFAVSTDIIVQDGRLCCDDDSLQFQHFIGVHRHSSLLAIQRIGF